MCGIAGGIHSGLNREQAASMLARLRHRGPDDSGLCEHEAVWLGNTRLAIQDLSKRGHQPMQTPNGRFTMVFNGEIYNHQDLRPDLEQHGVRFSSNCDTETLLYAYATWGESCLDRLAGDFAFAVLDKVKQEVFIARDRMGVKPLYYYWHNGKFLFASELKALTGLPSLNYELQPEALFQYLLFQYSPSADTPFRYVRKLLPGQHLSYSLKQNHIIFRNYDKIPFTGSYKSWSKAEWASLLDNSLQAVVKRQLHSDAPIGLTLSGGLDSSLIAAIARKAMPGQELHALSVNTHGAMKQEGFEDDFSYATLIAAKLGITLHEVSGNLSPETDLDAFIWDLDEPQADPAALHMSHISGAAHDLGIKVLLSGTGADDVFSGYRRHTILPALRLMTNLPRFTSPLSQVIRQMLPHSALVRRAAKLADSVGLDIDQAIVSTHFWINVQRAEQLFQPGVLPQNIAGLPDRIFERLLEEIPAERTLLNKMLFFEQRTFLPHHNLSYMDKLGMANSVEVRVPYADWEIVTLAAGMPPSMKLNGMTTKAILREVAANYLPNAIVARKKTGFGAPLRRWMKHDLKDMVNERLTDDSFLGRGIFSRQGIEALINDNQGGRIDGAYTLFSLLSIESWLRQFAPLP